MMRRTLLVVAPLGLLIACSSSSSVGESTAANITAARPISGDYRASCTNTDSGLGLQVFVSGQRVSELAGMTSGFVGGLQEQPFEVESLGLLRGAASGTIATSPTSATVNVGGTISMDASTRVETPDGGIAVTSTCTTNLTFASVEIIPHDVDATHPRSIIVHGVAVSSPTTCILGAAATHDWSFSCAEGEPGTSGDGLAELYAALAGTP